MTIRSRLALLFTLAVLALVAGGSYLFVNRLRDGLDQSLDARLTTRAVGIAGELRRPGDDLSTPFISDLRLGNPNGVYAQLLTMSGDVLNSSRGLSQPLISPAQAAAAGNHSLSLDGTAQLAGPDETTSEPMRLLVQHDGQPNLIIVVAISREVVDKAVSRATQQLVILCVIVLLLAGPAAWLLTRSALRPVERMRRQVAGMRADEVGAGLAIPRTHDEIARLANTFNGLLGRLHAAAEREKAFVTDAGHELRTPLAVLKGELELAQHPNRTLPDLRETISVAAEETDRLVRLAEDLLLLARDDEAPAMRLTRFALIPVVDQAVRAVAATAQARGVELQLATADPIEINGAPDRIRRAVDNLLTNAIRHARVGGWVHVQVESADGQVRVRVTDNGSGFPADFLPIAFARFTRADNVTTNGQSSDTGPVVGGNGLGLAIVQSVMSGHGGTATVANTPDGGADVTLNWPVDASVVRLRPLL